MADIISLNPHARRGAQITTRRSGPGAAVIIFPGIRYERPQDAACVKDGAPAAAKAKRGDAERRKYRT